MVALRYRKMVLMVMGNMAKSEEHYVGGSKTGWGNKNLTVWSSHEQFHVGDWLYFGYDDKSYSVLEVNKINYENCNQTGFIKNITGGAGRDVFELTEAKTYYFISGGGYCWQDVKVAINVTPAVAPAPQPKNSKKSASDCCQVNQTLVVLILVFIWGILFK